MICKVVLLLGFLVTTSRAATSNTEAASDTILRWMTVIEKAAKLQQTASGLANNFVMVIGSINTTANRERCRYHIKHMNDNLDVLVDGNGADISPAGNISNVVLKSLNQLRIDWKSYSDFVTEAIEKDWSDTSLDKVPSFKTNHKYFKIVWGLCDSVLDTYSNAATVDTGSSQIKAVAYAARQVAVADAISFLLIAQSHGELNTALDKTIYLRPLLSRFGNSHKLLLTGDAVQNIEPMGDMCKLYYMRKVSYMWNLLRTEINSILDETNWETKYTRTLAWRDVGVEECSQIRQLMYTVETLFMHDNNSCDPGADVTEAEVSNLINNAGKQRMLAQKAFRLMLNVKAGVLESESKVELVVTLDAANSNIDDLKFGSVEKGVPSPLSPELAKTFSQARTLWERVEPDLRSVVVNSDVDTLVIKRVAATSETLLQMLNNAAQYFVNYAVMSEPQMGATVIDRSGRQRMLMQKMSKEAMLVLLDIEKDQHEKLMHETMLTWRNTHYSLLRGGENKSNTSSGVPKTTNVCLLQQMQTALEAYEELESKVILLAEKNVGAEEVHTLNEAAFAEMNKAVSMYQRVGDISCTERVIDNENLIKLLFQAGEFAMSMEKVQKEFLQRSPTMHSTIQQISDSIERMVYGDVNISAPLTQSVADKLFDFEAKWPRLERALNDSSAEVTTEVLRVQHTNITVDEINALVTEFNELQKDEPSTQEIPVEKIILASAQRALLEKMAKEALLASESNDVDAQNALISSTELYETTHENLLRQTHAGMTDAASKMAEAENEWKTYKPLLQSVSAGEGGQTGKRDMQESLARLSSTYREVLMLYSKTVPVPEERGTANFLLIQVFVPSALICIPLFGGFLRGFFPE